MSSQPAWRTRHKQEDHEPGSAHPLAVYLLRPASPWLTFFADLGDHDWRAAEVAYLMSNVPKMLKHLENMGKRKRIAYVKKTGAGEVAG